MQGTQVPSLVREDSTCPAATKPTCYNYWARDQESQQREACAPKLEKDHAATKTQGSQKKKGTYISSPHYIHPLVCVCPHPLAFLLLCSLQLCRFQPILLTPFKKIAHNPSFASNFSISPGTFASSRSMLYFFSLKNKLKQLSWPHRAPSTGYSFFCSSLYKNSSKSCHTCHLKHSLNFS